jgi:hypothetical protein
MTQSRGMSGESRLEAQDRTGMHIGFFGGRGESMRIQKDRKAET